MLTQAYKINVVTYSIGRWQDTLLLTRQNSKAENDLIILIRTTRQHRLIPYVSVVFLCSFSFLDKITSAPSIIQQHPFTRHPVQHTANFPIADIQRALEEILTDNLFDSIFVWKIV